MNKIIKYVILSLNVIAIIFIYIWYQSDKGFAPIIAGITQVISALALIFEKKISGKTSISDIDDSKVTAEENTDNYDLSIKNVKNKSVINYKRSK